VNLKESDRYLTPGWIFDAEEEYFPRGAADLDPFWDPEGPDKTYDTWDIRKEQDAYALHAPDFGHDSAHVNGPYSADHPARTARLLYDWHRRMTGFESVNVCIAAVGSEYWREYIWPLHRMRRTGGLVIGWAGRLGFEAAVDIPGKDGTIRCKKGVTQSGNRSDIAIVASLDRPDFFAHLLRKHSPKAIEVTVL